MCQQYSHDPSILAAALLHDVLEDTPVPAENILDFLRQHLTPEDASRAMQYVQELTDIYITLNYPRMKRWARKEKEAERLSFVSAEAQTIKYADIIDNAVNIVLHDREFGYVYLKEAQMIVEKMKTGNAQLRERALHTVKECLEKVKKIDV